MGKAAAEPALPLLAQANAMLAKLAQESGMNVWLQVQQGLEKNGISHVIPHNQAHNILIRGSPCSKWLICWNNVIVN